MKYDAGRLNRKKYFLILLFAGIAGFFFIAFVFLYFFQDKLIFYNVNDPESRAFLQNQSGYSEISFTSENGKIYHGMMYKQAEGTSPLIIYFGGNGECSYQFMRRQQNVWRYYAGYNILFVDYEGYGLNEGKASYINMYEHSLAVYDFVLTQTNIDLNKMVVMGYSLGTGSAVYLAATRPTAGLILVSPYADGYDLYNNVLPIFKGLLKPLVKQKLPSFEFARRVTCPVLIIASRTDEIVPFSTSERLSSFFSGYVDFIELNNVNHNGIFNASGVYDRIQSFLSKSSY